MDTHGAPNSSATPAFTKKNEMTALLDQVAAHNRGRGALSARGHVAMDVAAPRVTTGAMMVAPDGVLPPVQMRDPRTAQAIPLEPLSSTGRVMPGTLTPVRRPDLPDFTKCESILIKEGYMVIDGMAFEIPPDDLQEIKMYMINAVTNAVTQRLAQALVALRMEANAAKEKMQPMSSGATTDKLPEEQHAEGRTSARVQDVPETARPDAPTDATRNVQPASQRLAEALGTSNDAVSDLRNPEVVPPSAPVLRVRRARRKSTALNRPRSARQQRTV